MAFLNKAGLQQLTNHLVKGENIKVSSHRGDNIKEVIDNITRECENVASPNTMTIENRVNEFRIGEGRDIDVSGDVETSKVSIELKGRTYQNLCSSSASFHAQYIDNYDIKDFNDRRVVTRISETKEGWTYCANTTLKNKLLKENTYYTLFFRYESSCNNNVRVQFINGNALNDLSASYTVTKIKDNIYRCVILTHNSFQNKVIGEQILYIHYSEPKKNGDIITLYKDMILLEGDYSQTPIEELPPFFEEIKSSFEDGVVNVEVQGKNLFDVSKLSVSNNNNVNISYHNDKLLLNGIINDSYTSFLTQNTLSKGTYSLRIYNKGVYWGVNAKIWGYNANKQLIANVNNGNKFTIDEDLVEIKLVIQGFTSGSLVDAEVTVQIEKSPSSTPYEPYYKKKISFNIGEPLRSLPNGVCDEIRNNNGQWELVRRVGKVVLDGSDLITLLSSDSLAQNTMRFIYYPNPERKSGLENLICDRFKVKNIYSLDEEGVLGSSGSSAGYLRIEKSKLVTLDVAGLKQWLQANPTTIYYELQTPIITPIEPIEFNIKPNATISINSDIAPISNHTVLLNRSAQIEQGVTEIAELKNRVEELEKLYNSSLIANSQKLSLLSLDYDLNTKEVK